MPAARLDVPHFLAVSHDRFRRAGQYLTANLDLACDIADHTLVLHLGRILMQRQPQTVRNDPELKRLYLGR